MTNRFVLLACIQAIILQTAYSQCVNRIPNCGCSYIVPETIIPNQVLPNPNQFLVNPNQVLVNPNQVFINPNQVRINPNQVLVNSNQVRINPNQVFVNPPARETVQTILPSPTTTIIQDSTVANNLANALQLLVVSNLLSNTLPCAAPLEVLPSCGPVEVFSGYPKPVEVFSGYPKPVEVFSGYPGPVEVFSNYPGPCEMALPSVSSCGMGGFNFVY